MKIMTNMNLIQSDYSASVYAGDNNLASGTGIKQAWRPGETRLGGAAKLTFGSTKANFGVGIEAGSRKSLRPDMNYDLTAKAGATESTMQGTIKNKSQFYATPTLSADVKISKNLSFNASADLNQGQAGIRWNF